MTTEVTTQPQMPDEKKIAALSDVVADARRARMSLDQKITAVSNKRRVIERASDRKFNKQLGQADREHSKLRREAQRKYIAALKVIDAAYNKKDTAIRRKRKAAAVKATVEQTNALASLNRKRNKLSKGIEAGEQAIGRERNRQYYPPKSGSFIAYKKVYAITTGYPLIAKLEVTKKALRVCHDHTGFKMRVSAAKVLAIWVKGDETNQVDSGRSSHDHSFIYKVGETVKPRKPFHKGTHVCASGIHCFMTQLHAANY